MEEMAKAGQLPFRLYVMVGDDSAAIAHYLARGPQSGLYDNHLWIRAIKLYADGALGSRGAALLEPYSRRPEQPRPAAHRARAHPGRRVSARCAAGFQVNTHAIGDRGNRVVLDAYEAALKANPTADHRFRVEHAQILNHDDIPRFAELGVIPSMQAVHQTSDMYWAGSRLGLGRLLGAYAWRSLLNTGVVVPNGSDFPVEAVNPLLSLPRGGRRGRTPRTGPPAGWMPEQRMTRDEALKSMTIWPAYAGFPGNDDGLADARQARRLRRPRPGHHDGAGARHPRHVRARDVYWWTRRCTSARAERALAADASLGAAWFTIPSTELDDSGPASALPLAHAGRAGARARHPARASRCSSGSWCGCGIRSARRLAAAERVRRGSCASSAS